MKHLLCSVLLAALGVLAAAPYPKTFTEAEKQSQRLAGETLQKELLAALDSGKKRFDVKPGVYRFAKAPLPRKAYFTFLRRKDFVMDGHGAEFLFEHDASAFSIYMSERITLKNMKIDYDPLPFTQGVITGFEKEKNHVSFRPDPGYEPFCERLMKLRLRGILFDRNDRRMKSAQSGFSPVLRKKNPDGTYSVWIRGFYGNSAQKCGLQTGDRMTIFPRTSHAFKIEVSKEAVLEDITLYSSNFIGFVFNVGAGDHKLIRCSIVKRPGTDRLMSGNADGFNAANLGKGLLLDSCRIDTIGDDFVNLHGCYARIFEKVSDTEFIVQVFQSGMDPKPELLFITPKGVLVGKARVKSSKRFTYTTPMTSRKDRWHGTSDVKPGSRVTAVRIVLDRAVPATAQEIFTSPCAVSAGSVIRNCDFRNSLARGLRLQTWNVRIENNRLDRSIGPMLTTSGQPGFWGESTTSSGLVMKNNLVLEGCVGRNNVNSAVLLISSPSPEATDRSRDMEITGNRILNSGAAPVRISNAERITVRDNTITAFPGKEPVITANSRDVKISGNKISK